MRVRSRVLLRWLTLCTAALAATVNSWPVLAQQNNEADGPDSKAQAVLLYDAGIVALKENKLNDARVFLLAAWRIRPHWQVAANLGDVELELGKNRDAAEHIHYFLQNGPGKATDDELARGRELLNKARAKVGALTVRVNVDGAEIFVNRKSVGKSPLAMPVYIEPGRTTIEARREGYEASSSTASLAAGAVGQVDMRLYPKESSPLLSAQKGSSGTCSSMPLPMVASSERGPSKAVLGIGLAASTVALGAGLFSYAMAYSKQNDDPASATNFGRVMTYSFIAGNVLGVGSTTYALVTSGSGLTSPTDTGVWLGPAVGGMAVRGMW